MMALVPRPHGSADGLLLDVRGLVRAHRLRSGGEVWAVRGLDLQVGAGERVALVGPPGCGKTTVLDVLAGLLPPTAGQVVAFGYDLGRLSGRELDEHRRVRVGYQRHPASTWLWTELSALDNVQAAMLCAGGEPRARWQQAIDILAAMGLAGRRSLRPDELDAAGRQRLALAVALANRPRLLLADEPAGDLDAEAAAALMADLDVVLRELGSAALLASHDIDLSRHTHRMVWMAAPDEAEESARLARRYLGA